LIEREYDLGVLLREDPAELLAGGAEERCRWLAKRTGLDATAIWEWGVVERVCQGLMSVQVDLQPHGRDSLAVADLLAARSTKESLA
jgi:streptomycin 6-kinase